MRTGQGELENRHLDDAIAESHASPRTFGAENEILHAQSSVGAEKAHLQMRPFLTFLDISNFLTEWTVVALSCGKVTEEKAGLHNGCNQQHMCKGYTERD